MDLAPDPTPRALAAPTLDTPTLDTPSLDASAPTTLTPPLDRPDLQIYANAFNTGFASGIDPTGRFQSPRTASARLTDLAQLEGAETAIAVLPQLGLVGNADAVRGLQTALETRAPGTDDVLDGRLFGEGGRQPAQTMARGVDLDDAMMITFPNQRINVMGVGVPFLGHAGVLLIDDETGATRYYEYGRYPEPDGSTPLGRVVKRDVPDAEIDPGTGRPTQASMVAILDSISRGQGDFPDGRFIAGAYFDDRINYDGAVDYAVGRQAENDNPNRVPYDIFERNCAHFMREVVVEGGGAHRIPRFSLPFPIPPTPNAYMDRVQNDVPSTNRIVNYDARTGTLLTNPLNRF